MSDIDNITIFDNLLSTEQIEVIKNLKNYNVCCDSVAGSGKTTTILGIAKVFKNDNICVITFVFKNFILYCFTIMSCELIRIFIKYH